MTRYIALSKNPTPPNGHCPACGAVMDDSGCRLGASYQVDPHSESFRRTGIARVDEVFCRGTPAHEVRPCPSCEERRREEDGHAG